MVRFLPTKLDCLPTSIDAAFQRRSSSSLRVLVFFSDGGAFSPLVLVRVGGGETQDLREKVKAAGGMKPRSMSQELKEHEIKRAIKVGGSSCCIREALLLWCSLDLAPPYDI